MYAKTLFTRKTSRMSVRRAFILNKSPARKRACEIKARLFDDKIIIRFKQPPQSPDSNGRGFLFSTCYVHYTFAVPYRVDMTSIYFKIELIV